MPKTGPGIHRHKAKGQWTTTVSAPDEHHTHDFEETGHPADGLTADEVARVKALLAEVQPSPEPEPEPEPPPPSPPPGPEPTPIPVQLVGSIVSLFDVMRDNTQTRVRMKNGTYLHSAASLNYGSPAADALCVNERFAGRTQTILVEPETPDGVIFDGRGGYGGIAFARGAAFIDWRLRRFVNCVPRSFGIVSFGFTTGAPNGWADPHHISVDILGDLSNKSQGPTAGPNDHYVYFMTSKGGPHDIVVNLDVDCGGGSYGIHTGAHFYHGNTDNGEKNAWNVKLRGTIRRARKGLMLWEGSCHDITAEGLVIRDSTQAAISYKYGAQRFILDRVVTSGSVPALELADGIRPTLLGCRETATAPRQLELA
ncbi:MAG: hypothetical protein Q8Q29_00580 [Actinomycetota bacterium]|nr:hypothetical protein [Actinomycetota bacterium]